jgi:hypothetical protein
MYNREHTNIIYPQIIGVNLYNCREKTAAEYHADEGISKPHNSQKDSEHYSTSINHTNLKT